MGGGMTAGQTGNLTAEINASVQLTKQKITQNRCA